MVKDCTICSQSFERKLSTMSDKQWYERKYCSLTCTGRAKRLKRLSKTCIGCKTPFDVPIHLQTRKFCSKQCKQDNQVLFARKGEQSPNWQGGITEVNNKIRHSKQYRDWRKQVFERDSYTCQHCHKRGGILNADHIKGFAAHPEHRFDLDNGQTLCIDCHKKTLSYARNIKYAVKGILW